MMTWPLAAVRALSLRTQGLATPLGREPSPSSDAIYDVIEQIGAVQVDSIQVVQRSHYLTLWSRLGRYDVGDLDRLIYGDPGALPGENSRRLFEYWLHASCILPLADYRYRLPYMRRLRESPALMTRKWLSQPGSEEFLQSVMERIHCEGPVGVADFEGRAPTPGGWAGWKPAKFALQHLFACGDLLVANRINFRPVYDLRERVLPGRVDTTEPAPEETIRHFLETAVRAFGACQLTQAADYLHEIKRSQARPLLEQLLAEGVFVAVRARLCDGETHDLVVHRDNLPLLEQAADGALTAGRMTFLNPFDSLFWPKGRDEQFWAFRSVLEAYKPSERRQWGYYCLAILYRDRLIGRFHPRLERPTGILRLKALYLEPGIDPDEELVADVAAAMRDFVAFHGASSLIVERSEPAEFGEKLQLNL